MRHVFQAIFVAFAMAPAHALMIVGPEGRPTQGCGTAQMVGQSGGYGGHAKPARGSGGDAYDADAGAKVAKPAQAKLQKSYASPGGVFRFHYDVYDTSDHRVSPVDADGSGVPDWVGLAAGIADSLLHQFGAMGYDTALSDLGAGGDTRYDIYLLNLARSRVYGFTYSGSNGYMEIDNDYAESIYAGAGVFDSRGARGLRVTLAHEMFHSIQFRYVYYPNPWGWWMEMTATFMEEVMCNQINDYYQYLNPDWFTVDTIFKDPTLGLASYNGGSVHPYSGAVFTIYLHEKFGEAALIAIRRTFENRNLDLSLIIRELQNATGVPMRDLLSEFWVWSYFSGARYHPQFFSEGAHYSPAPLDSLKYATAANKATVRNISVVSDTIATVSAAYLGAQLIRIVPDGSQGGIVIKLSGIAPYATNWSWRIAVAYPDVVTFLPVNVDTITGEKQVTIKGTNWQTAQDIVLVAANDATAGSAIPFTYRIRFLHPDAVSDVRVARFTLGQNTPNPFNPTTTIPFTLDRSAAIYLAVYDVTGRVVRTLAANSTFDAGAHRVTWDGTTDAGSAAGTGVYVVRLVAGGETRVRRMTLLR